MQSQVGFFYLAHESRSGTFYGIPTPEHDKKANLSAPRAKSNAWWVTSMGARPLFELQKRHRCSCFEGQKVFRRFNESSNEIGHYLQSCHRCLLVMQPVFLSRTSSSICWKMRELAAKKRSYQSFRRMVLESWKAVGLSQIPEGFFGSLDNLFSQFGFVGNWGNRVELSSN